jgi:hypothetical protein
MTAYQWQFQYVKVSNLKFPWGDENVLPYLEGEMVARPPKLHTIQLFEELRPTIFPSYLAGAGENFE